MNQDQAIQLSKGEHKARNVGQKVMCNGYVATVYRKLSWTNDIVEVRVPGGVVVASVSELIQFTPEEWFN